MKFSKEHEEKAKCTLQRIAQQSHQLCPPPVTRTWQGQVARAHYSTEKTELQGLPENNVYLRCSCTAMGYQDA